MAGEYDLQAISFSNVLKTVMQFDPRNVNGMFTLETGVTGTYHAFKKEKTLPSVQTKTTRNEATINGETEYTERRVYLTDNYMSELVDPDDKILTSIDPTSQKIINQARKLRRNRLAKCVNAGFGNAQEGKDSVTNVALPAGQIIADGNTGLTFDKIKKISKLINTGLDGAEDEIFCIIGESQRQDLLAIDELVNKFYNNGSSPLTNGKPINFYGITWVPIGVGTDILPKSGNVRSIMAFTKQAIGLAIGQDLKTYIDRLPQRTQSIQLYTNVLDGAVRIYDDQVVKINCVEA